MRGDDLKRRKIRAEAAAWLARLRADDLTDGDRAAFQAWLAKDSDHAQAFEAVNTIWEQVGSIKRGLRVPAERATTSHTRRNILAGLAVLPVAGAGFAYWQSAQAEVYQTDVGEQRHIVLKNGCLAFLDTDTRLVVRSDSVRLERGCVNFRAVLAENHPMVVNVADEAVTTARSNLNIRYDGGKISVLVIEGTANLSGALDYGTQKLSAGDRWTLAGSQARIDRPVTAPLLAWQNGQAIFQNDRLADAIAEMNRYSLVKLAASDAATANARISGVYAVGDNRAFASSVAKLLSAHVSYSDKRIEVSEP